MATTMVVLWTQSDSIWKKAYIEIGILTQVMALLTYVFEFWGQIAESKEVEETANFLVLETNPDKREIVWVFAILFCCFLQQTLIKVTDDFLYHQ